ncbi:MAG: hypothetical protein M3M87_05005 [Thermoproteota archaeon]|nr:hypothetical protein [Thermoproteota archaeon]
MNVDDIIMEDFQDFERVRKSGETNMLDVRKVVELTGMSKDRIIIIVKNYDELKTFFT